jgi:hypothetical protein
LDNFRSLRAYGWKGFKNMSLSRQDKGHNAEIAAYIARVAAGGEPLIPVPELVEATLASFRAVERAGEPPRPVDA